MRRFFVGIAGSFALYALAACSSDPGTDDGNGGEVPVPPRQTTDGVPLPNSGDPSGGGDPTRQGIAGGSSSGSTSGAPPAKTPDPTPDPGPAPTPGGPGPKPAGGCTITKDANGFFTRNSGKGTYVAYVPSSYDANTPMRAIVGLHGCGDTALNFASWGINPGATRASQTHIGISVGSETGTSACWASADDPKVIAAIDDLSKCFWIHQSKITIAGYSSGGHVAYRVGLQNAGRFAGIIIENSSLSGSGNATTLLAGASRKISIAHRAHTSDTSYPIANVKSDWTKITAAGFPLATSEVAGTHDGTTQDWANWLIPQSDPFSVP